MKEIKCTECESTLEPGDFGYRWIENGAVVCEHCAEQIDDFRGYERIKVAAKDSQ